MPYFLWLTLFLSSGEYSFNYTDATKFARLDVTSASVGQTGSYVCIKKKRNGKMEMEQFYIQVDPKES